MIFGTIVLGFVAVVLNAVGYVFTMTVLGGATAVCLSWMLTRLANPPRTMTLLATAHR